MTVSTKKFGEYRQNLQNDKLKIPKLFRFPPFVSFTLSDPIRLQQTD